jgi:hypothetical protein
VRRIDEGASSAQSERLKIQVGSGAAFVLDSNTSRTLDARLTTVALHDELE